MKKGFNHIDLSGVLTSNLKRHLSSGGIHAHFKNKKRIFKMLVLTFPFM